MHLRPENVTLVDKITTIKPSLLEIDVYTCSSGSMEANSQVPAECGLYPDTNTRPLTRLHGSSRGATRHEQIHNLTSNLYLPSNRCCNTPLALKYAQRYIDLLTYRGVLTLRCQSRPSMGAKIPTTISQDPVFIQYGSSVKCKVGYPRWIFVCAISSEVARKADPWCHKYIPQFVNTICT
jgi:hypothetical protein